jgi:hypothetical protein
MGDGAQQDDLRVRSRHHLDRLKSFRYSRRLMQPPRRLSIEPDRYVHQS